MESDYSSAITVKDIKHFKTPIVHFLYHIFNIIDTNEFQYRNIYWLLLGFGFQ